MSASFDSTNDAYMLFKLAEDQSQVRRQELHSLEEPDA